MDEQASQLHTNSNGSDLFQQNCGTIGPFLEKEIPPIVLNNKKSINHLFEALREQCHLILSRTKGD